LLTFFKKGEPLDLHHQENDRKSWLINIKKRELYLTFCSRRRISFFRILKRGDSSAYSLRITRKGKLIKILEHPPTYIKTLSFLKFISRVRNSIKV
jgi:hypothetical protein